MYIVLWPHFMYQDINVFQLRILPRETGKSHRDIRKIDIKEININTDFQMKLNKEEVGLGT